MPSVASRFKILRYLRCQLVLLPEIPIGSVIIWDNASFHQSGKLETLIEEGGSRLLFLPAYSPDLNPIEGW
jgi:transposase